MIETEFCAPATRMVRNGKIVAAMTRMTIARETAMICKPALARGVINVVWHRALPLVDGVHQFPEDMQ